MKAKTLLSFVGLLMLLLIPISAIQAQDELAGLDFTVDYPAETTVTVGNDLVQLDNGGAQVTVFGPTSYANIIGGQEFESEQAALEFFVSRNGYTVGEAAETDAALAAVDIELPRREQAGTAYLVDLDFGRLGVVAALSSGEDAQATLSEMTSLALDTFERPPDIVDIASSDENFSTLVAAVDAAGLVDTLRGGEFTVFAPTNDAFAAALESLGVSAEDILADTETLTRILQYHVVEGTVLAADVVELDSFTTLTGDDVTVTVEDGSVILNDSVTVTMTDITASNGVIHVIDGVLLPPPAEEEGGEEATEEAAAEEEASVEDLEAEIRDVLEIFETYEDGFLVDYAVGVEATPGTNLVKLLYGNADVTVFGPKAVTQIVGGETFDSDQAELEFILARNGYTVGEAADAGDSLAASNISLPRRDQSGTAFLVDLDFGRKGVIAAIAGEGNRDQALRNVILATALETFTRPADVVDVATTDENFSTLVAAVDAAGLTDALRDGEFTIFAPTNDAFAAALNALNLSAEDLLGATDALTEVLQYHVVEGTVLAADVVELDSATTLLGQDISISLMGEGDETSVMLNDTVTVTATDLTAANGVIHVIDAVLLPTCTISTESSQVPIRTGVTPDRAQFAFLPAGSDVPVVGRYVNEEEVTFYLLDNNAISNNPGQMGQAWVEGTEDVTAGLALCDVIPIVEPQ